MTSEAHRNRKFKPRIGVAAIFKNEAPYVIEWLAHHRLMGVDRFFIADNDSDDQTRDLLQQLAKTGLVSWMPWPDSPEEKPQVPAYRYIFSEFGNTVDWIAFIDADEYIWETAGQRLVDFLDSMPKDVGAIALNWATYGSSDQYFYGDASTPERFIWHAAPEHLVNHNFKTIARPSAIQDFTCPHNVILHPKYRYIHTNDTPKESLHPGNQSPGHAHCQSNKVHWDNFRINHYIIRSWEEYATKKSKRGRAYSDFALDELYFWGHDFHEENTRPSQSYAKLLQREVREIKEQIDPETLLGIQSTFNGNGIPPSPILGKIESIYVADNIVIEGWALEWTRYRIEKFDIVINNHHRITDIKSTLMPRPDVLAHHRGADPLCGFSITIKRSFNESIQSIEVMGTPSENRATKPLTWSINSGADILK